MQVENPFLKRTKWLTQALIISGAINIGLVATFVYSILRERQETLAIELAPRPKEGGHPQITNTELLNSYTLLPMQELLLRLENADLIEEGLTKRDLALACLVAFHHFNLDKALGGLLLQKRVIPLYHAEGGESIELPVFPGLADYQFQAILHYAKTEKWPFTSQGLFYEIQRAVLPRDPSLLDAFYLSTEYHAVHTLFTKTQLAVTREQIIDLLCQGDWNTLTAFTKAQRASLDLSPDCRRSFLLEYVKQHSPLAAELLIHSDPEFILKRLDDAQILSLLDLYPGSLATLEPIAKQLLTAPRTDAVHERAAKILYALVAEPLPVPYQHTLAIQRFAPQQLPPVLVAAKEALPALATAQKRIHTIAPGDSLWKISRKYRVSIEEIKRVNHLETEKLRPGKTLEIP
ncbi:MAG: LysM peptidoglycan-binding domain-containing protein [Verrucomicrobia bacterium]|nr:LysM peptidoglycan-binding domain-containing protein [Verrucomicrobiota bacterium]